MLHFLEEITSFLEKMDRIRDKILFAFIEPYWPRKILPNHLTFVRIAIGVCLFILLFLLKNDHIAIVLLLFLIGALTDLLDGSVARSLKKETTFGALLDPMADRILIIPIAVYSLMNAHPMLLFLLILLEVINALVSIVAQSKNIFIAPNIFGKIKMFLQSIVFLAILAFWPAIPSFFAYLLWLSLVLIAISIYLKIKVILTNGNFQY